MRPIRWRFEDEYSALLAILADLPACEPSRMHSGLAFSPFDLGGKKRPRQWSRGVF
jgi:hypothetical protein